MDTETTRTVIAILAANCKKTCQRISYEAAGEVVGIGIGNALKSVLGEPSLTLAWIVNARTGQATGYPPELLDQEDYSRQPVLLPGQIMPWLSIPGNIDPHPDFDLLRELAENWRENQE